MTIILMRWASPIKTTPQALIHQIISQAITRIIINPVILPTMPTRQPTTKWRERERESERASERGREGGREEREEREKREEREEREERQERGRERERVRMNPRHSQITNQKNQIESDAPTTSDADPEEDPILHNQATQHEVIMLTCHEPENALTSAEMQTLAWRCEFDMDLGLPLDQHVPTGEESWAMLATTAKKQRFEVKFTTKSVLPGIWERAICSAGASGMPFAPAAAHAAAGWRTCSLQHSSSVAKTRKHVVHGMSGSQSGSSRCPPSICAWFCLDAQHGLYLQLDISTPNIWAIEVQGVQWPSHRSEGMPSLKS